MEQIRTLMVCEKPSAAARIARALDEDASPRKRELQGVTFFECVRRDELVIVCSALGHLYGVDSKGKTIRRSYPVWDYTWRPRYEFERGSARLARWIQAINSLSKTADRFVSATDYDTEGSLIGHSILQYACNGSHLTAHRMKFSTMTEKELKTAFRNMAATLDFPAVEAGRCRHELDWLYGINLSRLLTEAALKQGRGYATMSTGRVQGPTLSFVVSREDEIGCFVPTPYWDIEASIKHENREYRLEYSRERIPTLAEAEKIVQDCQGKLLEVTDIGSKEASQLSPYPFDLSSLQAEAYRHLGYSPARTLAIAERLYLDALISYPRTSSQKLPPDIGYSEILRGIATQPAYATLSSGLLEAGRLRPSQGPKEDSAHPAIYPTGESPRRSLFGSEGKLFDLIVRRFMATFAEPSLWLISIMVLEIDPHRFLLRGSRLLRPGWTEFYRPYVTRDTQYLPQIEVGMQVPITRIQSLEKFTQPPSRYNPGSLLRKMEEENIGTKATRAEIIETLYRRGYIKDLRIRATPLGVHVTQLLAKYCPPIIDPELTAELESLMDEIQQLKATRRIVLSRAMDYFRPVMLELMAHEESLGGQLSEVVYAQKIAGVTFETPCPNCGSPLKIVRNRKSGKRFIGCTGKWEKNCSFTLPLPQIGVISILRKKCKVCGFQMIQARSRHRRPLLSCPQCYAKARAPVSTVKPIEVVEIRSEELPPVT